MITLVTCAMNEAHAIQPLLRWAGDLPSRRVLIDSGSTDATRALAEAADWEVLEHPFESAVRQLNWAFDHLGTSAEDWILVMDADEVPLFSPADVAALIEHANRADREAVAFRRRSYFRDRWIRHGGFYPDWQVRLFRGNVRYDSRSVHGHPAVAPKRVHLARMDIRHASYTSIDDYWAKLLEYTSRELNVAQDEGSFRPRWARTRVLYGRLPLRSVVRFVYRYVLRMGFLDGRLGWHLAVWSAVYEDIASARRHLEPRPG